MAYEFEKLPPGSKHERVPLFAGIELSYTDIVSDSFPTATRRWRTSYKSIIARPDR